MGENGGGAGYFWHIFSIIAILLNLHQHVNIYMTVLLKSNAHVYIGLISPNTLLSN